MEDSEQELPTELEWQQVFDFIKRTSTEINEGEGTD